MRILITGGTGFLGRHIVRHLMAKGDDVTALVRNNATIPVRSDNVGNLAVYSIEEVDYEQVFAIEGGFDALIHCATNYGKTGVSMSQVLMDNLIWPTRLLELCVKNNCKAFINTDTFFTKNYQSYEYLKEYTLSKHLFHQVLKAQRFIKIVNCRLEHLYGPEDGASKFSTYVVHELMRNAEAIKLSEGLQKRDFVFIEDVVNAYSVILDKLDTLQDYNEFQIGTGSSHSIRSFVEKVKFQLGNEATELKWGSIPMRANEFEDSFADITRLAALGWNPEIDLDKGISKLLDYYKHNGV